MSDTLAMETNQVVHVALRLSVTPVPLAPLTVVERSRVFHEATYDGLYARRAHTPAVGPAKVFVKGNPHFESAIKAADLARLMKPGKVNYPTGRSCAPFIFWQGFYKAQDLSFLERSVDDLEGVELYWDFNSIPLDFRAALGSVLPSRIRDCGVVAIWARRPDYPKKRSNLS